MDSVAPAPMEAAIAAPSRNLGRREPRYGAERYFAGKWITGPETSSFEGCWFERTQDAFGDFARLLNNQLPTGFSNAFEIGFIGRRADWPAGAPGGFGHLGHYPCQIEATKILKARELP
jgi:hypothetical protein